MHLERTSFGNPQGSVLRPPIFSIYFCDIFLLKCNIDIASYVEDTAT